jgi:hypothetical protein
MIWRERRLKIPSFSRGFDLNNKKTPSGGRWRYERNTLRNP